MKVSYIHVLALALFLVMAYIPIVAQSMFIDMNDNNNDDLNEEDEEWEFMLNEEVLASMIMDMDVNDAAVDDAIISGFLRGYLALGIDNNDAPDINSDSCWKKITSRGKGVPPASNGQCEQGLVKVGTKCFKRCPTGYIGYSSLCFELCKKPYPIDGLFYCCKDFKTCKAHSNQLSKQFPAEIKQIIDNIQHGKIAAAIQELKQILEELKSFNFPQCKYASVEENLMAVEAQAE